MCGRYSLFTPPEDLEERFGAAFVEPFESRYNAAPGQRLPVITNEAPAEIRRLEWGLVPAWADDDSGGLINARAETVAEKPSFRQAYERRRCLVLADGFYEWVETPDAIDDATGRGDANGPENGGKRPYRVAFADDRPFAMAGLWERWEPEGTQTGLDAFGGGTSEGSTGDGPLETFTIVTTEPNDLVADLHDRMAAILDPDEERRWLAGDGAGDGIDAGAVLGPHPSERMRAYPVSRAVNSPAIDEASLVEPI